MKKYENIICKNIIYGKGGGYDQLIFQSSVAIEQKPSLSFAHKSQEWLLYICNTDLNGKEDARLR